MEKTFMLLLYQQTLLIFRKMVMEVVFISSIVAFILPKEPVLLTVNQLLKQEVVVQYSSTMSLLLIFCFYVAGQHMKKYENTTRTDPLEIKPADDSSITIEFRDELCIIILLSKLKCKS